MTTHTAEEHLQRMEALVRRMAADGPAHLEGPWRREAREIVALLPEPVDPDWEIAAGIAFDNGYGNSTPGRDITTMLLSAIKRGRELERGMGDK